jgi:hypothetical protein
MKFGNVLLLDTKLWDVNGGNTIIIKKYVNIWELSPLPTWMTHKKLDIFKIGARKIVSIGN